jgi:hypothetical protein
MLQDVDASAAADGSGLSGEYACAHSSDSSHMSLRGGGIIKGGHEGSNMLAACRQ